MSSLENIIYFQLEDITVEQVSLCKYLQIT